MSGQWLIVTDKPKPCAAQGNVMLTTDLTPFSSVALKAMVSATPRQVEVRSRDHVSV